jgi:hypothetical protein
MATQTGNTRVVMKIKTTLREILLIQLAEIYVHWAIAQVMPLMVDYESGEVIHGAN